MSDKTTIEWTDALHESSRRVPPCVVPGNEPAGASGVIVLKEPGSTPARASDLRIGLAGEPEIIPGLAMLHPVSCSRENFQILGPVVGLVLVAMVNNLAALKGASEHFRGNETVFVDIPANVGQGVPRDTEHHVTVARDDAATLPCGTLVPELNYSHALIVANRTDKGSCRQR